MCRFSLASVDSKVVCVQNDHCQITFFWTYYHKCFVYLSYSPIHRGQVESSQGWRGHKWRSWRLHSNKSTWFGQLKTTEAPKTGGGQPCPLQKLMGEVLPPCLRPWCPQVFLGLWQLCFSLPQLSMAVSPGSCVLDTFGHQTLDLEPPKFQSVLIPSKTLC